jgi:hypothetical protein
MPRLHPGDHAPDDAVLDLDSHPVRLASLWPAGPTLLVFLRHFG